MGIMATTAIDWDITPRTMVHIYIQVITVTAPPSTLTEDPPSACLQKNTPQKKYPVDGALKGASDEFHQKPLLILNGIVFRRKS